MINFKKFNDFTAMIVPWFTENLQKKSTTSSLLLLLLPPSNKCMRFLNMILTLGKLSVFFTAIPMTIPPSSRLYALSFQAVLLHHLVWPSPQGCIGWHSCTTQNHQSQQIFVQKSHHNDEVNVVSCDNKTLLKRNNAAQVKVICLNDCHQLLKI